MSKTHTPGPWHCTVNVQNEQWIHSENISHIAMVSGPNPKGRMSADAHLIAAAPQMLEALEACADYWHIKHNPGDEHGELLSLSAERAQRLIRVALAAAKGEV